MNANAVNHRLLVCKRQREEAASDPRLCKRCNYVECVCGHPAFESYKPAKPTLLSDMADVFCILCLVAVAMALLAGFGGEWLR